VDRVEQQLSTMELVRMVMEGGVDIRVEDEGEGGRGVVKDKGEGVVKDIVKNVGEDVVGREVEMYTEFSPLPSYLFSSQICRL